MKNIHLIPTDKPSRLHNKNGELGNYPSTKLYIEDFKGNQHNSFHIYITSDEEIKVGDWFYDGDGELCKYTSDYVVNPNGWNDNKKIILTTDGDLIKDGVQAISDEFLEWFVKNPSCEEVEIDFDVIVTRTKSLLQNQSGKTIVIPHRIHYRIIIPKEEPKQETLEEAAEKVYPNDGFKDEIWADIGEVFREKFIEGAKWRQEQILEFLYLEITERRDYSASKMCEVVIEFIEQFKKK